MFVEVNLLDLIALKQRFWAEIKPPYSLDLIDYIKTKIQILGRNQTTLLKAGIADH